MYIVGPGAMPVSGGLYSASTTYSIDSGGSASWTASAGSPTSGTTAAFSWTPPASAQTVRITAVAGGVTAILDVFVTGYGFPYDPSIDVEGSIGDVTLLHEMESGTRIGRRKVGPKQKFNLPFKNRPIAEYNALLTLYAAVGSLVPFAMAHPITGVAKGWYFDSEISVKYGGRSCAISFDVRIKEA